MGLGECLGRRRSYEWRKRVSGMFYHAASGHGDDITAFAGRPSSTILELGQATYNFKEDRRLLLLRDQGVLSVQVASNDHTINTDTYG